MNIDSNPKRLAETKINKGSFVLKKIMQKKVKKDKGSFVHTHNF